MRNRLWIRCGKTGTSGPGFMAAVGLFGLIFLGLTGCQSEPVVAPPLAPEPAVATTLPSNTSLHADDLQPLRGQSHVFAASEGPHAGQQLGAKIDPISPRHWQYTLEKTRVVFLDQAADGSILIPREQDMAEAVDIYYDPAIPLLPGTLTLNQPVQGRSQMVVKNLRDGSVRDQGTCDWRISLTGRRDVVTPGGMFDAYIVEASRQIRLGLASVDVATLTAYQRGVGTVAESVTEKTLALGLVGGVKREVLKFVK